MGAAETRNEYVQAFERGLAVISAFEGSALTLSEVATRVEMSPAAARRYLVTLTQLGYFAHRRGKFLPLSRLLELSAPYVATTDPTRRAQSALRELTAALNETTTLTQLEGSDVINVLASTSIRELSIRVMPGRKLPSYCTAMGRAMLSLLPEEKMRSIVGGHPLERHTIHTLIDTEAVIEAIHQAGHQGYALVEEEHTPGIRTMSMAFRLSHGRVAALSAPTPTARESREEYIERVHDPLREAVAYMSGD